VAAAQPMAIAGNLSDLIITASAAPGGATKSFTMTLFKNGSTAGASCVIADAATTCTIAGPVSYARGDTMSIQVVATSGGGNTPAAATLRFTAVYG
jgi:hypothetical protein